MPVLISLAAFSGWRIPLQVVALFALCELVSNMIVEPLAYGQSAGVSQVALLAAIAFWTWLWGAIGLVLATPLTVCLVVLSKNVPELQFIFFLLADEPVLVPDVRLYQRLLAADDEEALEVVADFRKANPDVRPVRRSAAARAGADQHRSGEPALVERRGAAHEPRGTSPARRDAANRPTGDRRRAGAGRRLMRAHVLGYAASAPGDALVLQILAHELATDPVRDRDAVEHGELARADRHRRGEPAARGVHRGAAAARCGGGALPVPSPAPAVSRAADRRAGSRRGRRDHAGQRRCSAPGRTLVVSSVSAAREELLRIVVPAARAQAGRVTLPFLPARV